MGAEFVHHFERGQGAAASLTLLTLHGTGGNELDLVPLARSLRPGASILSPRGKVLERGAPRFFRRLAEGVFDIDDLIARAAELAEFVRAAVRAHQLDPRRVIAVGFSNGANIAAALHLLHADLLAGSMLFRSMLPLEPPTDPDLGGVRVLMSSGVRDPLVPRENAERLAALLRRSGAEVTHHWEHGGHDLNQADAVVGRRWLASFTPSATPPVR